MSRMSQTIKCRCGSDEGLGTLELEIFQSLRSGQWVFDEDTNLFLGGGPQTGIVSALLMKEDENPPGAEPEAPRVPSVWKATYCVKTRCERRDWGIR